MQTLTDAPAAGEVMDDGSEDEFALDAADYALAQASTAIDLKATELAY